MSIKGTTLLLGRVLAKTSPDGNGKVVYVLSVSEEEQRQLPSGVVAQRTSAGAVFGSSEACESTVTLSFLEL